MFAFHAAETRLELSRRAARNHARMLMAGPPRHLRLMAVSMTSAAAGAVAAAVFIPMLAVGLGALAALLLAIVLDDRKQAWRYAEAALEPGRPLAPSTPPATPSVAPAEVPAPRPAPEPVPGQPIE